MKQAYIDDYKPHSKTLALIDYVNSMIERYVQQGLRLSVRQIYYQLVAKGVEPENSERSYKRIVDTLTKARMAGLLDWDAIEDRGRDVSDRAKWLTGRHAFKDAATYFHMDLWEGQQRRVFVIVEKAALAGVLIGVCQRWDVPLLAARGYPSVSVLREMAEQFLIPANNIGEDVPLILHLGDHDPSGIDMTRDLDERLSLFCGFFQPEVKRIALTMKQIREHNPPPNPAKTTDSRHDAYIKVYGKDSWELDALEPSYLVKLVESHIKPHVDIKLWDERRNKIEDIRSKMNKTAGRFKA
jgi:hypothetical protein